MIDAKLTDVFPAGPATFRGRSGRWEYTMRHADRNHIYLDAVRVDGVRIHLYYIGPWAERTILRRVRRKIRQFERHEARLP